MQTKGGEPPQGHLEGYAFRTHLLQEGDILLCTDPESRISSLIRAIAGGNFSHAAICTFVPLFTEANDAGVAEISLARFGLKSPSNARVLRLNNDVPNREHIAATASKEAYRYSTREYGTIAAIASVVPGWGYEPGARAFCSYLVAAAYESAGLNLTATRKPPSKTTPADIEVSPYCQNITEDLLVRASWSPGTASYFLDSGYPTSPAQEYNIALREVAARVSALLQRKGRPAVADYFEAQRAYVSHVAEPWFDELDALFSESLIELGNPSLDRAEALTAEGRAHDIQSLPGRLAMCDRPSLSLMLQDVTSRIDTTERLMRDREKDLHVFGVGVARTNWKTPGVWLAHSQCICAGLQANLRALNDEQRRIVAYGVEQGWFNTGTSGPT